MLRPGDARRQMERTLNAAYGDGLLSQQTLVQRLDVLFGSELVVGRHDACDVVVGHPSVSRQHARLSFRDGHWVLRDLDSTNGTRVNGTPVVRYRLEPGDRLSLGSADLLVD